MQMKKVVILRRGKYGDLLCSLSLARFLKKKDPWTHLTLFIETYQEKLIPYIKECDAFEVIPKGSKYFHVLKLGFKYRNYFDVAICGKTTSMKLMNLFLGAVHAKKSYAYTKNEWHRCFVTHPSHEGEPMQHQALKTLKLIDPTVTSIPKELYPKLEIPQEKKQFLSSIIQKNKVSIFISISSNRLSTVLDVEVYATLLNRLFKEHDFYVIIACLEKELQQAKKLKNLLKMKSFIFQTNNFDTYLVTLAHVDLAFVSEGGSSHFAAALDRYQVSLFGFISPINWGPLSDKAITLYHREHVKYIDQELIFDALHKQLHAAVNQKLSL